MLLNNFNTGFFYGNSYIQMMDGDNGSAKAQLNRLDDNNSHSHYGGVGNGAFHVVIGAGTTAPTKTDYDLADSSIMAADKMASITHTATFDVSTGATNSVQWRNESNANIVVKEIGLAYKVYSQNQYNKHVNILVARSVLTTPVSIAPGETYVFTYNIRI